MDNITCMADLQQLVASGEMDWKQFGEVAMKEHEGLILFDYTPLAEYANRWNWFERNARGLILNRATGEVVARPFDKFWNWMQNGRFTAAPIVSVTEKVDGSLGILYRHHGQFHIATRGSFTSEQALWATEFLHSCYSLGTLPEELTLLFEIIYPGNRIVVDYGNREDLVLLAARNRVNDAYLPMEAVTEIGAQYDFTLPQVFTGVTVDDLIAACKAALEADHEGFVAEFADGQRFKFKTLRYLELHRLIANLSFRHTLEAIRTNTSQSLYEQLPDEFQVQVREWEAEIRQTADLLLSEVELAFNAAPKDNRKMFALWVKDKVPSLASYLFAKLDGKDVLALIYEKHFKEIR